MMEVEDSRTIILASVLSVVAVALLYLYCCGRKRRCGTEYFYQKTVFNTRAVERLRTSVGDYQPPWWFHPGWAALEYRRDLKVAFVRELVSYSDGTTFAVDWFPNAPAAAQRSAEKVIKICLYFPGLGGNSTKTAVQNFARVLASSGYICGVVNQRGNTTPLKTTRLWHPGLTEDAERMITDIFDTFNGSGQKVRIFLAGTSGSTNVIKKVLLAARSKPDFSSAKSDSSLLRGSDVKLSGGLGTCICFDYCANRRKLESTLLGRATSKVIASHYQGFIRQNPDIHAYFKGSVLERLLQCRSLSEFDGLSSTELYGYASERAFMDDLSSTDMKNMSLPYLAIQPGDDPVYGNDVKGNIPTQLYTESEHVIFMVPSHGGHGAFSEGSLIGHLRWQRSNEGTGSWPPRVAAAFFDHIIEQEDHAALRAGYIHLADN